MAFIVNRVFDETVHSVRLNVCLQVMDIHSTLTNVSVPMSVFVPNANYEAHVRSKPQADYKGVWSHWGPAIHWTTGSANVKKSTGLGEPIWMFIYHLATLYISL